MTNDRVNFRLIAFGIRIDCYKDDYIILSERVQIPPSYSVNDVSQVDSRIVGGEDAVILDHPYQVSFIVNNSYFCGGFIVSENYILTAAHCAQNVDPSTVVLRAGSSYRTNGTIIPIAEVKPHPEYDNPPFDKDVAYMKTVEPMNFTDTIQPIALPPKNRILRGEVIVSGWGRTQEGASTIPDRLMSVKLRVVNYYQCYLVYPTVLTRNMWCGGNFFLGGQGTCQGDSGGAAIQDGMAVGIVSFGRGCGQPLAPSVFANIAAPTIRDFISNNTGL
ncbi:trypsin-3-like [Melitaea cinxia]|uniref:trypsin-3-like n=1 Tax=Melitaea cinxia TaxID=113334 RepID=UPI001E26F28A|nr:trypsin-3-like [Melitaea cinxia]